jgi:SpoVK/Ycf46/Vps4 family AAA+-type ATPase
MNIFDLIIHDREEVSLDEVFLNQENRESIFQLIREFHFVEELSQYGLPVNNKVLLQGNSGCGKTMTAKAIAKELGKKIYILNLSNVVSSRIGETSQNLKQVFDKAGREHAVLFLDEFDHVGKSRGSDDKEVGEMRRLVTNLIQLIDNFPNKALLICATNHPEVLDIALMRRFQLRIHYTMPSQEVLDEYYSSILSKFPAEHQNIPRKYDVSFAEAKDYALTLIKSYLLKEWEAKKNEQA